MNYYPFHIGDFRSGTLHLSDAEELAYRRLLDWYYDTESPIPLETQWVARRLRVGFDVLENVLKDFFVKTEEGWRHERCDTEIALYHRQVEKNRANGKKGGRPRKAKPNPEEPTDNPKKPTGFPLGSQSLASGNPDETHCKGNQEPRTKNQEPEIPPIPPTGGGVGADDLEPHQLPRPVGGGGQSHPHAGIVCAAIKKTGVGIVNASHPTLNALLHGGATIEQFEAACKSAIAKGKNFSYALGIVQREMEEGRDLAKRLGAKPAKPSEAALADPARYGSGVRAL